MENNSFEYNGFTYTKQNNGESSGVDISHNIPYPEKVFKYYAISRFSVDAITKGYFFASHPFELNDYLDSSPFLLHCKEKPSLEKYNTLFQGLITEKELNEYFDSDKIGQKYIQLFWDLISNIFGIISLTSKEHSPLMWPHYTQEKGFQISFSSKELEKSIIDKIGTGECFGLYPINYSEQLQPVDLSAYKEYHIPFFYATNLKSKKWEYEDEWRFLIGKQHMGVPYNKLSFNTNQAHVTSPENRYTFYNKDLVEQITLGVNFFTTTDFEIEWLDEKNIVVKPKKGDDSWNYESYCKLLAYINDELSERLYYSGIKYETNEDITLKIIRTKERMMIKRIKWNTYQLTRTKEIIKFF
jgi:hypothetical protein